MTTNEDTTALIAELRGWTVDDAPNSIVSILHRAAAALEVAMQPHADCEAAGARAGDRISDLEARLAALTAPQEGSALAAIERVRALHRRSHAVFSWASGGVRYEDPCPECDGKAGVHPCGCWAEVDIEYVCSECKVGTKGSSVAWPCPTIAALDRAPEPSRGVALIAAERARQVTEEGYDAEHDRGHEVQIVRAAQAYIGRSLHEIAGSTIRETPIMWPWRDEDWKPTGDPRRTLTKAGALIAAAIDALPVGGESNGE